MWAIKFILQALHKKTLIFKILWLHWGEWGAQLSSDFSPGWKCGKYSSFPVFDINGAQTLLQVIWELQLCWIKSRVKRNRSDFFKKKKSSFFFISFTWQQNQTNETDAHIQNMWQVHSWSGGDKNSFIKLQPGFLFLGTFLVLSSLGSDKIFRIHPCEQKTLRMDFFFFFFWMHNSAFPVSLFHTHFTNTPASVPQTCSVRLCVQQIISTRQRSHSEYL